MDNIKLYTRFIIVYLKCRMEYKVSFLMDIMMPLFSYTCNYLVLGVMIYKFHDLNGWSFYELMFLYSLNLFSYGLSGLFFYSPMGEMEEMINSGNFDGVVTKPMNPFIYLICQQFQHTFLAHIVLSIVVMVISSNNLSMEWTLARLILFIIILFGATLIQASFLILLGSLSFWFTNSTSAADELFFSVIGFVEYPISIYNKAIQILLTFILPYAFVNFYPAEYFLNKSDKVFFSPVFQLATPVIGIILFAIAYTIWQLGLKSYKSTGS